MCLRILSTYFLISSGFGFSFNQECIGGFRCSNFTRQPPDPRVSIDHDLSPSDCISPSQICDGTSDCDDSSDESDCCAVFCRRNKSVCTESSFENVPNCRQCRDLDMWRCDDGRCVPIDVVCDGKYDCADWSDETALKCCNMRSGKKNMAICPLNELCVPVPHLRLRDCGRCLRMGRRLCDNSFACVAEESICDGYVDCSDGTDEENCCSSNCQDNDSVCRQAGESYFDCDKPGTCVPKRKVMDGHGDCPDKSDEKETLKCFARCDKDPSICISYHDALNRIDECRDCGGNRWRCQNGDCIERYYLCDGKNNCLDGDDEAGCKRYWMWAVIVGPILLFVAFVFVCQNYRCLLTLLCPARMDALAERNARNEERTRHLFQETIEQLSAPPVPTAVLPNYDSLELQDLPPSYDEVVKEVVV